ncbi:unnamed protein product [Camellia sinensis]
MHGSARRLVHSLELSSNHYTYFCNLDGVTAYGLLLLELKGCFMVVQAGL